MSAPVQVQGSVRSARQLYKYLFRMCDSLPDDVQQHYKHFVRQGFNSHSDETDEDRIQEIISKSVEDAEWVAKKYRGK